MKDVRAPYKAAPSIEIHVLAHTHTHIHIRTHTHTHTHTQMQDVNAPLERPSERPIDQLNIFSTHTALQQPQQTEAIFDAKRYPHTKSRLCYTVQGLVPQNEDIAVAQFRTYGRRSYMYVHVCLLYIYVRVCAYVEVIYVCACVPIIHVCACVRLRVCLCTYAKSIVALCKDPCVCVCCIYIRMHQVLLIVFKDSCVCVCVCECVCMCVLPK
jgi:hypothetical protein